MLNNTTHICCCFTCRYGYNDKQVSKNMYLVPDSAKNVSLSTNSWFTLRAQPLKEESSLPTRHSVRSGTRRSNQTVHQSRQLVYSLSAVVVWWRKGQQQTTHKQETGDRTAVLGLGIKRRVGYPKRRHRRGHRLTSSEAA